MDAASARLDGAPGRARPRRSAASGPRHPSRRASPRRAPGIARVIVPQANRAEAELVDGVRVIGAVEPRRGRALARCRRRRDRPGSEPVRSPTTATVAPDVPIPDLAEVIGQREAVDALVVAAAGGHHLLMCGPPGAGKTMLARRLPGILPALDDAAALTAASIRSLAGDAGDDAHAATPPFEAPHHTASVAALVGGGIPGRPARARSPAPARASCSSTRRREFPSNALDALRQPLESGAIVIHRAGATARVPGAIPARARDESVSVRRLRRHGRRRASARRWRSAATSAGSPGPLLDRIDIELSLAARRRSRTR